MKDICSACDLVMDLPDGSRPGGQFCDDCAEPGRTFALTIIGLIWLCMAGLAWYLESVLLAGIGVAVALVFALLVVLLECHGRAASRRRR